TERSPCGAASPGTVVVDAGRRKYLAASRPLSLDSIEPRRPPATQRAERRQIGTVDEAAKRPGPRLWLTAGNWPASTTLALPRSRSTRCQAAGSGCGVARPMLGRRSSVGPTLPTFWPGRGLESWPSAGVDRQATP